MRKGILALLAAVFLLLGTVSPALADDMVNNQTSSVSTFGYNDYRDRVSGTQQTIETWPAWKNAFGASYSQPLIVDLPGGQVYVVAVGGGSRPQIAVWKNVPASPDSNPWDSPQNKSPIWAAPLDTTTTAPYSHPSLYDMNGHYIVFVGTNADSQGFAHIMAFDITKCIDGSKGAGQVLYDHADPNASSDIVSAPLLMEYQGHYILIYSDGNSGHYDLLYNIDELASGQSPSPTQPPHWKFLNPGSRTSSSPAPVMNGTGFAVGIDTGGSPGAVYVYRLQDLFTVQGNQLVFTSSPTYYGRLGTDAGMDASFSVDPYNTNNLYFGDSRSNIYSADLITKQYNWENSYIPDNPGLYDAFSNRSPAFYGSTVYFPFGTSINDSNMSGVIAVNEFGNKQWVSKGQDNNGNKYLMMGERVDKYGNIAIEASNAQTAPVVVRMQGQDTLIFEGLGDDTVDALDSLTGQVLTGGLVPELAKSLNYYAQGISGEISVADGIVAMGTQDGIFVAGLLPTDLSIDGLTLTDQSGQALTKDANGYYDVVGGQQYTATATVDYTQSPSGDPQDTSFPLAQAPIAGLHGIGGTWNPSEGRNGTGLLDGARWYAASSLTGTGSLSSSISASPGQVSRLADNGNSSVYTINLQSQGQTPQFSFTWTAPMTPGINAIGAAVNLDFPPGASGGSLNLIQHYPEVNLGNNLYEVPVKVEAPQLVVSPSSATVQVGRTQQFTATYYPQGQGNSPGRDVTGQAAWSLNSTGVATVGAGNGLASGQGPGSATIQASYDGVTGMARIYVIRPYQPPQPGTGLTFQATSQSGNTRRPANTAKWTDYVQACLRPLYIQSGVTFRDPRPDYGTTVAPPYPPAGPYGAPPAYSDLTGWSFAGAILQYPQQNPAYSFGHPLPPSGTLSRSMSTGSQVSQATVQEMWAEDGTPVFDVLAGRDVGPPQGYTLTAGSITVNVHYRLTTWHWVSLLFGGYWAPSAYDGQVTQTLDPVSGRLLVNGTGAAGEGL